MSAPFASADEAAFDKLFWGAGAGQCARQDQAVGPTLRARGTALQMIDACTIIKIFRQIHEGVIFELSNRGLPTLGIQMSEVNHRRELLIKTAAVVVGSSTLAVCGVGCTSAAPGQFNTASPGKTSTVAAPATAGAAGTISYA